MRKYDFLKAKQIIEEEKNDIKEASLGMHEDWFWTAESVFANGEFTQDLTEENLTIGGIQGSLWATPTLNLEYKNGNERMIPCYKGVSSGTNPLLGLGVLSAPVQAKIKPLEAENDKK